MASIHIYQHQCTLRIGVIGQAALITYHIENHGDQDNSFNVYLVYYNVVYNVITECKTEILGEPEFLHRYTGFSIFRQRINGNILYRFIRKWFCVWSFQRYNQYNVINHQHNNENPLY